MNHEDILNIAKGWGSIYDPTLPHTRYIPISRLHIRDSEINEKILSYITDSSFEFYESNTSNSSSLLLTNENFCLFKHVSPINSNAHIGILFKSPQLFDQHGILFISENVMNSVLMNRIELMIENAYSEYSGFKDIKSNILNFYENFEKNKSNR